MMKKYFEGLAILMASVWVGGMWTVGYIVAPVLFQSLQDKALAGMLAGKLFAAMAYTGIASATYLMLYLFKTRGKEVMQQHLFLITLAMLLLVLLGQFGLQPVLADIKVQALPLYVMDSMYADRFSFWHGAASILYLLQSLLGIVLLFKVYRGSL
jgi:hypothetical protein